MSKITTQQFVTITAVLCAIIFNPSNGAMAAEPSFRPDQNHNRRQPLHSIAHLAKETAIVASGIAGGYVAGNVAGEHAGWVAGVTGYTVQHLLSAGLKWRDMRKKRMLPSWQRNSFGANIRGTLSLLEFDLEGSSLSESRKQHYRARIAEISDAASLDVSRGRLLAFRGLRFATGAATSALIGSLAEKAPAAVATLGTIWGRIVDSGFNTFHPNEMQRIRRGMPALMDLSNDLHAELHGAEPR